MADSNLTDWKSLFDSKQSLVSLFKWNQAAAFLSFVQGLLIIILSVSKAYPVTTNYLTVDPLASQVAGHSVMAEATKHLFDLNLAVLIGIAFFISTLAHLFVSSYYRKNYETDLKKGVNKIRWINYGLSIGLMILVVALLSGVYDLSSLILIFFLVLIMNLLSLVMESYSQKSSEANWLAYGLGCLAGILPWAVLLIYIIASNVYGSGLAAYLYWLYLSVFIIYAGFSANLYLKYKKIGKWTDYLYVERAYIILSLLLKSALAWQVFGSVLHR